MNRMLTAYQWRSGGEEGWEVSDKQEDEHQKQDMKHDIRS